MKTLSPLVSQIVVASFLSVSGAWADVITLSNGRTVEGRVLSRTEEYVRLEAHGMITKLRTDSIRSIERAPEHENTLLAAETALKRRDPVKGIDLLFQARKEGAPDAEVKTMIERLNSGISGGIHGARSADERSAIRRSIHALMKEDLLTSRTLFFASQNFFQLEDWELAAEALHRIPTADLQDDPVMRQWALDFMRQMVKRRLARDDFEGALTYVERMRRTTDESSDANLPLAHLARSSKAREQGDYAHALKIIAEDLAPTVPEIARNRALYTIDQMKDWAERTRKFRAAREAVEPLRGLYPAVYTEARNHLLARECRYLLDNDQAGEALALLDAVPEEERSEEMQSLHNHAYHEYTIIRIESSEPLELLEHGRWCLEHGLMEEAMRIFNKTRENPNLRDLSDQFLANARRERDIQLLEQAKKEYELGDMTAVLGRTNELLQNPNLGSRLSEEARRLNELARKTMNREQEARGPRAEVFYQRAERAHILQKHDESLSLLNLVLSEYTDTPAAGRAADLLPHVVRALELAYLEGRRDSLPKLPDKMELQDFQQTDRIDAEMEDLLDEMNQKPVFRGSKDRVEARQPEERSSGRSRF